VFCFFGCTISDNAGTADQKIALQVRDNEDGVKHKPIEAVRCKQESGALKPACGARASKTIGECANASPER
jgi:hypothetical protein